MSRVVLLLLLLVVPASATRAQKAIQAPSIRTKAFEPERSLAQIQLGHPHCSVVLLASEPAIRDPVDVAFDDAGRLWVVEMSDYPIQRGQEPTGRIRVLEDLDADGMFEHARTFAERLTMPTGLAFWEDGVVVTLAGQVVFLRDTDANGEADQQEQWLTGFSEDNEQLRANHPRFSVDGCGTLHAGYVEVTSSWGIASPTIGPLVELRSKRCARRLRPSDSSR